jgi:uncharacterized lipoprotein YddW (UPF0748 family)
MLKAFLACLLAVSASAAVPSQPPTTWAQKNEMRAGWVVGWRQMTSPQGIDDAVAWAVKARLNTLFVQVRVSGDAYYRSDLVPRAETLKNQPADFDPLAYMLKKARAKNLKVHAWFNTGVIWRGLTPPVSPLHAFNAHPEWILKDAQGRIAFPRADDPKPSVVEGNAWVEWGNPELRAHMAAVAAELVERYPVDGIHFDFVRYPARMGPRTTGVGYDPISVAAFKAETGLAPSEHTRAWDEWREAQVGLGLRAIRDAVKAKRPSIEVSAAVLAAWNLAEGRNFTAYRRWTEDGILDFAVLMDYFPDPSWVYQGLVNAVETLDPKRIVAGYSIKAHPPERLAEQLDWSRTLGMRGFALFSLDKAETPDPDAYLSRLRDLAVPDVLDARYASREPLWNRVGVLDAAHRSWNLRFYTRRGHAKLVVYPRGLTGATFSVGDAKLAPVKFSGEKLVEVNLAPYLKPFARETEANHDFILGAASEGEGGAEVFVVDSYAE